jgi:hypothetical protein
MNIFNANTPFAARVQTVQTIDQAYEAALAASMDRAPYNLWRLGVLALLAVLLGGAGLTLALALGLADPPHAGRITYQTDVLDTQAGRLVDVVLYGLPELPAMPFTLEAEAANGVGGGAAWGVWLRADGADRVLLVDNRGYMLTTLDSVEPQWREFMHIQPPRNQLYLHVENGLATFRINRELVASIPVNTVEAVGLALHGDPRLTWEQITLHER